MNHLTLPDLHSLTREELLSYYRAQTEVILSNSQHPELLRPIVNRMILRLENSNGSVKAYVKSSQAMWKSFDELHEKLQTFLRKS